MDDRLPTSLRPWRRDPEHSRQVTVRLIKARQKLARSWAAGGLLSVIREFWRLTVRALGIPTAVVADIAFDLLVGVRTRGVLHPGNEIRTAARGGDPKSYGT